jgi:hypothetical protein
MVAHEASIHMKGSSHMTVSAVVVRNVPELREALRQRQRPVEIIDPRIIRAFRIFAIVQGWTVIGALMAYAISSGYKVDFRHTEWTATKTTETSVTLTPTSKDRTVDNPLSPIPEQ